MLGRVSTIAEHAIRIVDGAEGTSPRAGRPQYQFQVTLHGSDPTDRLTSVRINEDETHPIMEGDLPLLFACIGHELERRRIGKFGARAD